MNTGKLTWKAAILAAVIAAGAMLSGTVFAGSNLLTNGDFETGDMAGWTTYGNIGVATRGSTWISGNVDAAMLGTYGCYHQTHHQQFAGESTYLQQTVAVNEVGTYRYSLYYAVRPGSNYGGVPFQVNIISPSGETNTVERITPSGTAGYPLIQVTGTCKLTSTGSYIFQILQPAPAGIKHSYGNVYDRVFFAREIPGNLLTNGDFEIGDMTGWTTYGNIGVATRGSTWISGSVDAATLGTYGCYHQTHHQDYAGQSTYLQQTVAINEIGTYRYSLHYAVRPGRNYGGVPFQVNVISPSGETNTVRSITPSGTAGYPLIHVTGICEITSTGNYIFQILQPAPAGITHSYGNAYDNIIFSHEISGNLIRNGAFDEGNVGTTMGDGTTWGAVSGEGASIPYWTTTNPDQTGLSQAQGTWVASGLDVGQYALYYQRNKTETHAISQNFTVAQGGLYRLTFKYTDRPGSQYLGFPFQLQLVHNDETNVVFNQSTTFSGDTMRSFASNVLLAAGEHTLQFYIPAYNNGANGNGTGIAFDDVTLVRVNVLTAEWTGEGAANDLSDPDNWLCMSPEGNVVSGALPEMATTIHFSGSFAVDIPPGSVLNGLEIVFDPGATLSAKSDWSGVDKPLSGTLDINGKEFTLSSFSGNATITDGTSDASAPGELHVNVASGTVCNDALSFTGNMRFVKEGAGAYRAQKAGQTYTGGTHVKVGTVICDIDTAIAANRNPFGPGDKTQTIRIEKDAVLDLNNNINGSIYNYELAGKIVVYGSNQNAAWNTSFNNTWMQDIVLLDDATIEGGWFYLGGNDANDYGELNLNGKTLTLNLNKGSGNDCQSYARYLRVNETGGTIKINANSAGALQIHDDDTDFSAANLQFEGNAFLFLSGSTGAIPVNDFAYEKNYWGAHESYSRKVVVGGVYKAGAYRPPVELMNGATLDLSTTNLCWDATGHSGVISANETYVSQAGEVTFASGATVTVNLTGREAEMESLANGAVEGNERGYVMTWTTKPTNVTFLPNMVNAEKYMLTATDTGLRIRKPKGLVIIVK